MNIEIDPGVERAAKLERAARRALALLKDIHVIATHDNLSAFYGIDNLARDAISCLDAAIYSDAMPEKAPGMFELKGECQ